MLHQRLLNALLECSLNGFFVGLRHCVSLGLFLRYLLFALDLHFPESVLDFYKVLILLLPNLVQLL